MKRLVRHSGAGGGLGPPGTNGRVWRRRAPAYASPQSVRFRQDRTRRRGRGVNKRVLVVDDEPNILMSLEFLMKRAGFEVDVARDGRQALAALEGAPPDLMLLDVMMPEFDGYEVCARVRERPEWSGTKIVMLTARGRDAERERGLKAGADAYVTKPFSTRELVEQVKRMLAEGGATAQELGKAARGGRAPLGRAGHNLGR